MTEVWGTLIGVFVLAIMLTILILFAGSYLILRIMKWLHPERGYGKGESCGGISSIDSVWFK